MERLKDARQDFVKSIEHMFPLVRLHRELTRVHIPSLNGGDFTTIGGFVLSAAVTEPARPKWMRIRLSLQDILI